MSTLKERDVPSLGKMIAVLTIVAILAMLAYFVALTLTPLVTSKITRYFPITDLEFQQENRWVTVNSAFIYHVHRIGAIYPHEALVLQLNVTNPTNETIGYYPVISVKSSAGTQTEKEYSTWWLQNHTTQVIPVFFFIGNEGDNIIDFSLHIRDINGYKFPDEYANATGLVPVLSSVQLLETQNYTLQFSVIISAIVGSMTFVALYLTWTSSKEHTSQLKSEVKELQESNRLLTKQKETADEQIKVLKEQNQLYRDQFSEEIRPWISLSDTLPRGDKEPNIIRIYFKNLGKSVAKDVIIRSLPKDNEKVTKEELGRQDPSPPIALAPKEIFVRNIDLTPDLYSKTENSDSCHFGVQIDYKYGIDKTGQTILTGFWQASTKNKTIIFEIKDLI